MSAPLRPTYEADLEARIVELEAANAALREAVQRVWKALPKDLPGDEPGTVDAAVWVARVVAERDRLARQLEIAQGSHTDLVKALNDATAERDRLKGVMKHIAITADIGLNIGPVIRMAQRALDGVALSPVEGE